ncbi:MAG: hypothetical protein D6793_10925 [Thermoflexia bacterium]|nr:MAG: hypothetical protein D6793_10925 [Thermoflexia bacterium]
MVSLSSPTSFSVDLARAWNVTLIGYARGRTFRVYSGAQRIAWHGVRNTQQALETPGLFRGLRRCCLPGGNETEIGRG